MQNKLYVFNNKNSLLLKWVSTPPKYILKATLNKSLSPNNS